MIIKSKIYTLNGICKAIIEGNSGIEYVCSIDWERKLGWCSCPAFVYSKNETPCKHIFYLNRFIEIDKMKDKTKELLKIPTGSKKIDELLGGGVPYKLITTIFAEPMVGKTWCAYQIGVNSIKETGKDTLLIDTEGIISEDFSSIVNKLGKRFGVDEEILSKKFKMIKTYNDKEFQSIQKLMMMFGYNPEFSISEGGRYKIIFHEHKEKKGQSLKVKPLDEELKNVGLIIIDSLTKPVKDSVGSDTANLPSRAQIVERLFGRLYQYAELYNIAIIVLHHASVNPTPFYGKDIGHAYGGNPIYYNSKYILQILNGTKNEKELVDKETNKPWGIEARRIQLIRRPDEQATGERIPIRLKKDYGFSDS